MKLSPLRHHPLPGLSGSGVTLALGTTVPATLDAGLRLPLNFTVSAPSGASSAAEYVFRLTESHGFTRQLPVHVTVHPAQVVPKVTPQAFELGITAGQPRTQVITVENVGYSTWTEVNVSTPTLDWVYLMGSTYLGNIPPGGNRSFTITFLPPANLPSGAYVQNPLVTLESANLEAYPINAGLYVTASGQGNAAFSVGNADKATTDAGRWISGADVTVRNSDVYMSIFPQSTDGNGTAQFGSLPAGNYTYTISSSGFQSVNGTFTIEPGLTRSMEVLLPTTMVSYKWTVTPTTIEDKYDIKLDMTFKTDVPAPVLVFDPPIFMLNMEAGQTVNTQVSITNKGIVAAQNVKLTWPDSDPALKVTSPYSEIASIGAGQTIVVPVKIYLEHLSPCHSGDTSVALMYECAAHIITNVVVESAIRIIAGSGGECPIEAVGVFGGGFQDGGAGWSSSVIGESLIALVGGAVAGSATSKGCSKPECNECQERSANGQGCVARAGSPSCGMLGCGKCSGGVCHDAVCSQPICTPPCYASDGAGGCVYNNGARCGKDGCGKCSAGECKMDSCIIPNCGPCQVKIGNQCYAANEDQECSTNGADACTSFGICKSGNCDLSNSANIANDKFAGNALSLKMCPNMWQFVKPSYNGCGTTSDPIPGSIDVSYKTLGIIGEMRCGVLEYQQYCNTHDECFSTCGSDMKTCNKELRNNFLKACGERFGYTTDCAFVCEAMLISRFKDYIKDYVSGSANSQNVYDNAQHSHCACCQVGG